LDLKTPILQRISAGTPWGVWTAADFLNLATRDVIAKPLRRVVATDTLRKIHRSPAL